MELLQIALLVQSEPYELARSALPDAPVVPEIPSSWTRTRLGLAGVLHRLADHVAPEPVAAALR
jgi:hypothetical protein